MAVPKRKVSRARRDKRRSQVWKLSAPSFSRCKQCGELKLAHRVCGNCGYYKFTGSPSGSAGGIFADYKQFKSYRQIYI